MQAAMEKRPGLHGEWRIGHIRHRFSNPVYLLPVINALRDQPGVIDVALNFHCHHSTSFWEGVIELYVSTSSGREATTKAYESSGSRGGRCRCGYLARGCVAQRDRRGLMSQKEDSAMIDTQ